MRELEGASGPSRKFLDPCGQKPAGEGKVSETEELQGRKQGDCRYSTEVDHTDMSNVLQNIPYRTGGSVAQAA